MSEKANQIKPLRARMLMHAHTPRGWKVKMGAAAPAQQRGGSGLCDYTAKSIHIPHVCDDYSLVVFYHEVGHAKLHKNCTRANHICEYEAEMWAHAKMRETGFRVTRLILRTAKEYVGACIIEDEASGIEIDPKIRRWVGLAHSCRW